MGEEVFSGEDDFEGRRLVKTRKKDYAGGTWWFLFVDKLLQPGG